MQKVYPYTKSNEHDVYKTAVRNARLYAREMNHDVSLRGCKEFDQRVLRISLASRGDNDYYTTEIIRPTDPL